MAIHYFARDFRDTDGAKRRFRYMTPFSDSDFERLTELGLPPGWVAYHFEPGETGMRVDMLRTMPAIMAGTVGGIPIEVNPTPMLEEYQAAQKRRGG